MYLTCLSLEFVESNRLASTLVVVCIGLRSYSNQISRDLPKIVSTLIVGAQRFFYTYYTCSGLCVGSVFEEECSEMWYALWIVRFRESIEFWTHNVLSEYIWTCVCLSGYNVCVGNAGIEHVSVVYNVWIQPIDKPCMLACCLSPLIINNCIVCITGCYEIVGWLEFRLCMWTWDQACTPAEFKHIDKRRKIHNAERLQSLRMNED